MLLAISIIIGSMIISSCLVGIFCFNARYEDDSELSEQVEKIIDSLLIEKDYGDKLFYCPHSYWELGRSYLLATDKGVYVFYFMSLDLVKTSFTNEKTNENYIIWSD